MIAGTAAILAFCTCAPAWAQSNRTFVSGHGADTGMCTLAAPCRSFAYAMTQTASGGEITVLDSAGYGALTINQPLTITNPGGVEAGITAGTGATAITITASSGLVTLRGLTLEGVGVGANGIMVNSNLPANGAALTVNILGCDVEGFTADGIAIQPTSGGAPVPSVTVNIADGTISSNGTGIVIGGGAPNVFPSIYRTIVSANAVGMTVGTGETLLISSHVDHNTTSGITLTGITSMMMKNSSTVFNSSAFGVDMNNGSFLFLYDRNTVGTVINNNTVYTDGTNNIANQVSGTVNKMNLQ